MGLIPRPWTEEEWEEACDNTGDGLEDSFLDPRTGELLKRDEYNPSRHKTKTLEPVPLTEEDFVVEIEKIEELSAGVFHIKFWYLGPKATPMTHDTRMSKQPCRVPDTWTGTDDDYIDDWLERRVRLHVAINKRQQEIEEPGLLQRKETKNRINAKFEKK